MRSFLVALVKKSPVPTLTLARNIVYTYPTINALSAYLTSRFDVSASSDELTEKEKVYNSIQRFSNGLRIRKPKYSVAVTGTTGSAGTFLLAQLIENPQVNIIWCLNRKSSRPNEVRQADGFKERGIDAGLLEKNKHRVRFLDVDLSDGKLGLSDETYNDVSYFMTSSR